MPYSGDFAALILSSTGHRRGAASRWQSPAAGVAWAAFTAGLVIVAGASACADDPAPSDALPTAVAPQDRHPELRRLSPTEEVWIDRERGEVVVGVGQDNGLCGL